MYGGLGRDDVTIHSKSSLRAARIMAAVLGAQREILNADGESHDGTTWITRGYAIMARYVQTFGRAHAITNINPATSAFLTSSLKIHRRVGRDLSTRCRQILQRLLHVR
jgi:hypothetical protein